MGREEVLGVGLRGAVHPGVAREGTEFGVLERRVRARARQPDRTSDATPEVAERHGARVFVEPFKGYGPQKQSALDKADHYRLLNQPRLAESICLDIWRSMVKTRPHL